MAQATALKPRHGCRVSFDRLSLRCFPWRLPISGSGTPVRPRGMLDRLPEATGFHSFAPSSEYETVPLSFECLIWRLRLGRGSMLCAPILHSRGGDGFIRANNAIDGMAFK